MKFTDLRFLARTAAPAEQLRFRVELFARDFDSIAQNRISLWEGIREIPSVGKFFLPGVCPSWNFYDLYLLDCLNSALMQKSRQLAVLDLDNCDLLKIQDIFGMTAPQHPPMLGVWEDGVLIESGDGWKARNRLMSEFGFSWQPAKSADFL